ncbi:MAG TPA: PAS domain S-box protein [Geobacteraceae bacterium]
MSIGKKIKDLLGGEGDDDTARRELEKLAASERAAFTYIRRKVNQLLTIMGTLPLRPEELSDQTLLELDPIGIIADSFEQVLEHLNETNEKLRFAEEELQAIIATAGVGIIVVDSKMRIQAFNLKAKELFFRASSDVRGKPCHVALCGSDSPPPECTFEKVMATRIGIQLTNWVYNERHYDVAGTPIKNKYGDITKVVLIYTDITDRKRTEDTLRGNEEMYRTIFDNASDLILSLAPDGSFRYANQAWCRALGYRREEMGDLALPDLIHPDHRDASLAFVERVLAGKKNGRFATVFLSKRGEALPLEGHVSCSLVNDSPSLVCFILHPRRDP